MFNNKTLLITGGTGSFGQAVLERFLHTDIKEIRIFSRDEKKQDDLRRYYNNSKLQFYIGDIRDPGSIDNALNNVDYVFHAAALKQVPSCEFFPMEAVKTNIIGTDNVLTSAINLGVRKVICLSTDKAAYPVNAMGISKAMMEKTLIARSRTVDDKHTLICGTRYGNVIASRGSVVPLFINQIKTGQRITLTDPLMTRFIMSLEEAVELVIYAFNHGEGGDILIQKAPSAYIGDIAKALLELFNADNEQIIIGSRHGEKTYEVLMTREEAAKAIDHGSYYRIPSDGRDLNYEKYLDLGYPSITSSEEYSSNNTKILSIDEIKDKLMSIDYVVNELKSWKV